MDGLRPRSAIEGKGDVTLIKFQDEGFTKIHMRFKGGKTETLTTLNRRAAGRLHCARVWSPVTT